MNLIVPSLMALLLAGPALAQHSDAARLKAQAARVTIVRDDWGIAHVRGKTDADAVFGAIYAQAEDDFNRYQRLTDDIVATFADQATRYTSGDFREVYFYPEQLTGHTERTYHPGE